MGWWRRGWRAGAGRCVRAIRWVSSREMLQPDRWTDGWVDGRMDGWLFHVKT